MEVSTDLFSHSIMLCLLPVSPLRYQWTAPKSYWKTELWYCFLSATSKASRAPKPFTVDARLTTELAGVQVYLGAILFLNILNANRFDDAVSLGGSDWTLPNLTAYCLQVTD
eukprot:3448075-Prymnesium_polylepis.1